MGAATTSRAQDPSSTLTPVPLWRRRSVLPLLVVALLGEGGLAVLNISTMPIYLAQPEPGGRGLGASAVGLVLVAFLFSEAAFKGPMGHLADRYGPKTLMFLGPLLNVVSALLTLAIPNTHNAIEITAFCLLRVLDGLGAAMLWPAAFAAMGDAVEDSERQQAMSLLNLCYLLAIALALPVGGVANDLAGVHWAGLPLAAILFAIVAVAVWRLVPTSSVAAHHETEGEFRLGDFLASARKIPQYLLLTAITFIGVGFPTAVIKLFPVQQFGMSETQIGGLVLPAAIAMAVLSVPISRFGERVGRARAVHVGLGLGAFGMALIAIGAVVPALRSPWLLALGAVPAGLGFLLAIPSWMASVSDIEPRRRAANLGAVMTAQGLGAIVGLPVGAALYEYLQPVGADLGLGAAFGRYCPFIGCFVCLTAAWLLSLKLLRHPA